MIEVVAVQMRERLGLEPWEPFAARARVRLRAHALDYHPLERDPDRATGRSTREALRALARCRVRGLDSILVVGDRHDFRLVEDLVTRLGLSIRVFSGNPDYLRGTSGGALVHQDHHAASVEQRRRLLAAQSPRTGW